MQLKKLEMCGFKSFANRTEFTFGRGITGVVGPNGCGKSNVVDAIKWVLGTQSYKSVRGEEMLDVIFKGAQGVSAMGFAEVSLTLDNSDHTLPIEFEEVCITRKIFSSGDAEYSINKSPCRLKDIRELLYGTGIGTDNYSVIEQGKIDRLVLSNPHERRLVFEEAAGISKFRAKKRETENRLEKVAGDLLRIQDVVHEVQKQLRSVRAQAGRASRYKELAEDLKGKRLRLAVHDHRSLAARGTDLGAKLRAAEERRAQLKGELEAKLLDLDEVRKKLEAEAGRHADLAASLAGLESQASYLERSIASAESRCRELEAERGRADADREALEAKASELTAQLEIESAALAELDETVRARTAEQEEVRRRLDEAVRECSRASAEHEVKKGEAVELAHKETQFRNEQARLQREHTELAARVESMKAQDVKLEAELAELRSKIGGARETKGVLEQEIAALIAEKKAEDVEQANRREERTVVDRELVQLREGKNHRVARRETLRDLESHFEGLEAGARTLLREKIEGVLGTVADFLEVPAESVAAVEGALGDRAGAVVCDTSENAEKAVAFVRERNLGRTIVIALDECKNGYFTDVELLAKGVLGRAGALVLCDERYRPMVEALLGHTLVVEDRGTARLVRSERLTEWPLVTPDGDYFDHPGLLTTGGARAVQGLISRKAELRKLEEEIGRYMELVTEREQRQAAVEQRLKSGEEKIDQLRHDVYDKNMFLGETSAQIEQLAVREQFLDSERVQIVGELEAMGRQSGAVADRAASLETLLAQLGWLNTSVTAEIQHLAATLERYESGKVELQNALTHARVESAKAAEQRLSVGKRREMLEGNRDEAARALDRVAALAGEIAGRHIAALEEKTANEAERADLAGRLDAERATVEEAAKDREALAEDCDRARAEKGRVESDLGPCEDELNRLRIEEEGLRIKGENLSQRAREELEIDLAQVVAETPAEEIPDPDALSREVDELRAKISGFGAVNVVALEQLTELEEREKYMLTQTEDLTKSKGQLEELIRELNKESRDLFEKTFEFVKEQFGTIFRKIFGGGKADIILEQGENIDLSERGLEIMARPPGKELTSISLLSGGERSLTAIALVMALFKANPSPFCLLDEADAALDEKNVERYAGVVKEYAADTQFIVITHNKRTMAVCDTLHGVTQEQQGVSKRVSVNLSGDSTLDMLKGKGGLTAPVAAVATQS
ncbi:MAG TPA: chromosome segregation protein SMC [Planctomycetota bacterium]|nr:chromosome segregation protein SMC [Planctomycetota bacterium]